MLYKVQIVYFTIPATCDPKYFNPFVKYKNASKFSGLCHSIAMLEVSAQTCDNMTEHLLRKEKNLNNAFVVNSLTEKHANYNPLLIINVLT